VSLKETSLENRFQRSRLEWNAPAIPYHRSHATPELQIAEGICMESNKDVRGKKENSRVTKAAAMPLHIPTCLSLFSSCSSACSRSQ